MPVVPGGISSAARRLPDLEGRPFKVAFAAGCTLHDTEGRRYIDYALGMGATILGHAPADVVSACTQALQRGAMPGFTHDLEEEAAHALVAGDARMAHASFVTTGSEAVHLACRIARASTGRARIAKMAGGFDGWYDDLAFGLSGSPEAGFGDERPVRGAMTLTRANDPEDLARLFAERDDIAAILVEPMLANSGCLELSRDYIEAVQRLARQHGAMIIADEVLMGLRLRAGPSSAVLGLDPDLITMGKAIGSGVAVAAVLGTHEGFSAVHDGRAARAGTYHGNPLAAAAVLATMRHVARADYPGLLARGRRLRDGLERLFQEAGHQMRTSGVDSAFSLWLAPSPPRSYAQALQLVQPEFFARLHLELRREGVLTIPGAWARLFVCFAHDDAAVAHTLAAYRAALARLG